MGNFDRRGSNRSGSGDRQMYRAVCGKCGDSCEVPFKPSGGKPVLCSNCFEKSGNSRSSDSRDSRGSSRGYDRRGSDRFGSGDRQMHQAICDKCGNSCEVPFKPSSDKPVFCSDCFEKGSTTRGNDRQSNQGLEALSAKLDQIIELLSPKTKASAKKEESVKKEVVSKTVKSKVLIAKKSVKKVAPAKKAKAKKK